ncbi:hypothetical protein B0H13DRAFT_883033 [Mycena leptocephala]|nr:hypothetical protein B0H13DRAFT_883033 [Mycena leptocephala]
MGWRPYGRSIGIQGAWRREATNCPGNPRARRAALRSSIGVSLLPLSSALLTRYRCAPRTTRWQRLHDPFLRPPSALSLRFLSFLPPPAPGPLPPLPILRAHSHTQTGWKPDAMEGAAARNTTSPPRCERWRTMRVPTPPRRNAQTCTSPPARGPMAQSGSHIAPRPTASRTPATHAMAPAGGRGHLKAKTRSQGASHLVQPRRPLWLRTRRRAQ